MDINDIDENTLMKEDYAESILRDFLINKGFKVKEKTRFGTDILATNQENNQRWFIEVKGTQKPNGDFFDSAQMNVHITEVMGQISTCYDVGNENDFYGILLPFHKRHVSWVNRIKKVRELLSLNFIFVNSKEELFLLKPPSAELDKMI